MNFESMRKDWAELPIKATVINEEYVPVFLAEVDRLREEVETLEQNSCGDCTDGWKYNRVEGRYACTCMTEMEPFQILKAALDKLARLGNGDRIGNSDGNRIAIDALKAISPLEYTSHI